MPSHCQNQVRVPVPLQGNPIHWEGAGEGKGLGGANCPAAPQMTQNAVGARQRAKRKTRPEPQLFVPWVPYARKMWARAGFGVGVMQTGNHAWVVKKMCFDVKMQFVNRGNPVFSDCTRSSRYCGV